MSVNWKTLAAAVAVALLGVLNEALTGGTVKLPPVEQWIVPIISMVLVAVTKHIKDTQGQ